MPYELWHGIFKLALGELQPTRVALPANTDTRVDTRPLLRLTHVSRRWREVALGSPDLWTRFDCHNADQASAFIERSQDLPVSVFLATGSIPGDPFTDDSESDETPSEIPLDILASLPYHRLRRLDLEAFLTPDTVTPLIDIHAPRLECLTISSLFTSDYSSYQANLSIVGLLQGDTEALAALAISPAVDWLPSNTFPNLTHLHIAFEAYSSAQPVDVIRLLANTPRVGYVFIGELLGETEHDSIAHGIVPLHALRHLVFSTCRYKLAFQVLRHLDLPNECFVRMHDILVVPEQDGQPSPLPVLPLLHHVTHLDIAASEYELLLVADGPTSGFWIQTHIDGLDGPPDPWNLWVSRQHPTLPFASITSLHIYVHHTHTFWPTILSHVPQLVELSAVLGSAAGGMSPSDELCDLLASASPVRCPALRVLRVQGIPRSPEKNVLSAARLADMLYRRDRSGHRVSRLDVQLSAAEASMAAADRLRDCVDVLNVVSSDMPLCDFEMRDVWKMEGMEEYWEMNEYDKPKYILPRDFS